jgi:NodT family efflux transporter outer membrane factor (OMF) lipoprotein
MARREQKLRSDAWPAVLPRWASLRARRSKAAVAPWPAPAKESHGVQGGDRFLRRVGGWCVARALIVPAAAASLAACAVGPNFKIPVAPEVELTPKALKAPGLAGGETQRFAHGVDIPGAWWMLFHSRALNNLVERALRDNHDLKTAQAALRVAHANVLAQFGAFFPVLTANYNPTRQQVSSSVLIPSTPNANPFFTLQTGQLLISYVPDVFGPNVRSVESLQAMEESQRFALEATHLTLTSNIALAAVQEASVRGQIDATEKIIKIEKELLIFLKQQFEAGQVSQVDVAAQEAALAAAEQALPPLQKQLAVQRDLLTALSGHFAGEGIPERFDFKTLHLPKELPVSVSSQVVEQRPDIRAAEANLHSVGALVGVSIANRLPIFNLTGNVGRQGTDFGDFFRTPPPFQFWTVAANITQTIFDGFTLEQKQRAAEAGWDQVASQYRATVVTAFQNVADAMQAVELDGKSLRAAVAAEEAADKSLRLTREQLELGQVSALQLLTAQQVYYAALLNVVQAKASRYADTIALFQALGGGWWNRSDVEEVEDRWGRLTVVLGAG